MLEIIEQPGKPAPAWAPGLGTEAGYEVTLVVYDFGGEVDEISYEQLVCEKVFKSAYSSLMDYIEDNDLTLEVKDVQTTIGDVRSRFFVKSKSKDTINAFIDKFGDWDEKLAMFRSCPLFEGHYRNWRIASFANALKSQDKNFDIEQDDDKTKELQYRKKMLRENFTLVPVRMASVSRVYEKQIFRWLMNEPTGFWYVNRLGIFFFKEDDATEFKKEAFIWNLTLF